MVFALAVNNTCILLPENGNVRFKIKSRILEELLKVVGGVLFCQSVAASIKKIEWSSSNYLTLPLLSSSFLKNIDLW